MNLSNDSLHAIMNGKNGKAVASVFCTVFLAAAMVRAGDSFLQQVTTIDSSQPPLITGNGDSGCPVLSPDGRYVLFASSVKSLVTVSNNPVAPTPFPQVLNVFLRDRTNGTTTLISLNTAGTAGGNADSWPVNISTNGHYVVFESYASNLVANDTNNAGDVFIRDLENGTTSLVSMNASGEQGNAASRDADMTPDGRYVAFVSSASNLVPNDTNGIPDIFVRDMQNGTTTLVSEGAIAISASNSSSEEPQITPDGHYVAFRSTATNLVTGVRSAGDIYVRDLVMGTTTWASVDARARLSSLLSVFQGIAYNQAITADGKFVFYEASQTNIPAKSLVLRYSSESATTDVVSSNAFSFPPEERDFKALDITPDGRFVAFVTTNGNAVNVFDTQSWTTSWASPVFPISGSFGIFCHTPIIGPSGQYVAFLGSTNITGSHIYLYNRISKTTQVVEGTSKWVVPLEISCISTNGPTLAFSCADGLLNGDRNSGRDVFVRDMRTNTVELVSVRDTNLPSSANGFSQISAMSLSYDGRYAAFSSFADNLVANDTNGLCDVFVHDFVTGTNKLVTVSSNGLRGAKAMSTGPIISPDGRYVAFNSWSNYFVYGYWTDAQSVFVRDLQTGTTSFVTSNSTAPSSFGGQYLLTQQGKVYVRNMPQQTYSLNTAIAGTSGAMTPDGRYVASWDSTILFVWDNQENRQVYTNRTSSITNCAISSDGNRLFILAKTNLYAIDRATQTQTLVGTNFSGSSSLQFSSDGQFVVFRGPYATPSVTNTQILLYDFGSGQIQVISQNAEGEPGNDRSDFPAIGFGNRFIAYRSRATNLIPDATNGVANVFLYDRQIGATTLISSNPDNTATFSSPCLAGPVFSGDGKTLVFGSMASELAPENVDGNCQLFACTLLCPSITSVNQQGFALDWLMPPGKTAQVQFRDSLNEPWKNLPGNVIVQGNRASLQDSGTAQTQRFYRVVVQ